MGTTTWRGIACTFGLVRHAYERFRKHYPGRRSGSGGRPRDPPGFGYWITFDKCPDCGKERVLDIREGWADMEPKTP